MASFAYVPALGGLIARKIEEPARPAGAEATEPDAESQVADRWFFDSSFELKQGLLVREVMPDVFPPEAFKRLFRC